MKTMVLAIVSMSLIALTSMQLSAGPARTKPPPPTQDELDEISERGMMLVDYEAATAAATDAIAKVEVKSGLVEHLIATDHEGKWVVAFGKLSPERDAFLVAYEAKESDEPGDFKLRAVSPPRAEEGFLLTAAKAVELVVKDHKGPEIPFNILILPAPDDQIWVYLVPAPTEPGVWLLGGDSRYLVSADGDKIVEKRNLHDALVERKAPKESEIKPEDSAEHKTKIADMPEDTDVYHVLTRDASMPEIVITPHYKYKIDLDGEITLQEEDSGKPKDSKPLEKDQRKDQKPDQKKTPEKRDPGSKSWDEE